MIHQHPTLTRPTEPIALLEKIIALADAGRPFAVATVLKTDGSTPVPAGAKAVIEPGGTIYGTVGGGAVEAEAIRRAQAVIPQSAAVAFESDLRGPGTHEPSPICGGTMRLLVDATAANHTAAYRRAVTALQQRGRGLWLTTIRHGISLQVSAQFLAASELDLFSGPPDPEILRESFTREIPVHLMPAEAGPAEYFCEPLLPKPVLLIIGGGHVGQAVAVQAGLLGFDIAVIEDRPEFANPALFPPGTQTRCGVTEDEVAAFPIHRDTFIVIVTRGHQSDSAALRACILRPAAYIGMIGSRRKVPLVRQQFLENGWATPEEFARVYAPIGLDIGALTVPEIATSIMAQIIAVRRRGSAARIPLNPEERP